MENLKLKTEVQKIFQIFRTSEGEIRPHFILTGPSGSGKTHIVKSMVEELDLGYIEINAAQLTKEGTSGNSLSKALSPLMNFQNQQVICFVDEFDKLFISGNSNSDLAHETTNGVQNEFLKVLESDNTSVFGDYGKYLEVSVANVLFVFAGAFNGEEDITLDRLRDFGVKTEFLGRVGLAYSTTKLSLDFLIEILNKSELLKIYLSLYPTVMKGEVIEAVKEHLSENYEKNNIGARLISTLIHQFFIKGGRLKKEEVKSVSFQKTLVL
jgi:ATP-dependent protease Clp ATPase subunit